MILRRGQWVITGSGDYHDHGKILGNTSDSDDGSAHVHWMIADEVYVESAEALATMEVRDTDPGRCRRCPEEGTGV